MNALILLGISRASGPGPRASNRKHIIAEIASLKLTAISETVLSGTAGDSLPCPVSEHDRDADFGDCQSHGI